MKAAKILSQYGFKKQDTGCYYNTQANERISFSLNGWSLTTNDGVFTFSKFSNLEFYLNANNL